MWRLKGCPKCRGDLYVDKDHDGWFEECLQCGYEAYLQPVVEAREMHSTADRQLVSAGVGEDDSE